MKIRNYYIENPAVVNIHAYTKARGAEIKSDN
jgi:hypothetical protein